MGFSDTWAAHSRKVWALLAAATLFVAGTVVEPIRDLVRDALGALWTWIKSRDPMTIVVGAAIGAAGSWWSTRAVMRRRALFDSVCVRVSGELDMQKKDGADARPCLDVRLHLDGAQAAGIDSHVRSLRAVISLPFGRFQVSEQDVPMKGRGESYYFDTRFWVDPERVTRSLVDVSKGRAILLEAVDIHVVTDRGVVSRFCGSRHPLRGLEKFLAAEG